MSYSEVIVDIETLGINRATIVLSIGAVVFNFGDEDNYDDMNGERVFYAELQVPPQQELSRTTDWSTIQWWTEQNALARQVLSNTNKKYHPSDALSLFNEFLTSQHSVHRMWGNGNTFDNAIIRSLCEDFEIKYPIKFWNDLDLRTLLFTAYGPDKRKRPRFERGIEHHALDDAKYEVLVAQAAWNKLHS